MKDICFQNKITKEKTTAFKYAYEWVLNCYKNSEKENKTAHPDILAIEELIEIGKELLYNDDEWEMI